MSKNNCNGCIWRDCCMSNIKCDNYYSEKYISDENDDYYNNVIKEDIDFYYENLKN